MKNLKMVIYALCLAGSLAAIRADDSKDVSKSATANSTPSASASSSSTHKATLTDEQKTLRKELLDKYDTNHDGKIDREERKKVTDDDKAKLKKAGLTPKAQKRTKKTT